MQKPVDQAHINRPIEQVQMQSPVEQTEESHPNEESQVASAVEEVQVSSTMQPAKISNLAEEVQISSPIGHARTSNAIEEPPIANPSDLSKQKTVQQLAHYDSMTTEKSEKANQFHAYNAKIDTEPFINDSNLKETHESQQNEPNIEFEK